MCLNLASQFAPAQLQAAAPKFHLMSSVSSSEEERVKKDNYASSCIITGEERRERGGGAREGRWKSILNGEQGRTP